MIDLQTIRRTLLSLSCLVLPGAVAGAPTVAPEPLRRSDFTMAAPQGFGDRDNSQTWGAIWFQDSLYIGTGRSTYCIQQATLELFQPFPDPYPPQDKDVDCPPDPHDIPLQAEIWRWKPQDRSWTRVYQSPQDVPIMGTDKFTARDIGFRGMIIVPELQSDGSRKNVLYVSGVSSRAAQGSGVMGPVPPPRILRSEDGVTFTPIPQDPGTFMGDTLVSGFRTMKLLDGKLYVVASVGLLGHGIILESESPWLGNDAFRQVSPEGLTFFEIETYRGALYAGTGGQPANGDPPFSLLKMAPTAEAPYEFREIIPEAAYRPNLPGAAIISMHEFKNRLFVGSDRELFRVNPDDSWDLVIGSPRETPEGFKSALGGINIGFDTFFGIHMWRMAENDGWLYIGTQDQSTKWRNLVFVNSFLEPGLGFDLYATNDGWHFTRVSRDGFSDLFNNGARNMLPTPRGFFLGTANHYYGQQLFRAPHAKELPARALFAPQQVELEIVDGDALLSWEPTETAVRYHVYRDTWFAETSEVATIDAKRDVVPTYIDTVSNIASQHHYFVIAENAQGELSGPSAIGRIPSIGIVPDFELIGRLLVADRAPAKLLQQFDDAQQSMTRGDHDAAVRQLRELRTMLTQPDLGSMPTWKAEDLGILVDRLIRRVRLAKAGLVPDSLVL